MCLESAENALSGQKIRTTEPTVSLKRTTGSDSFGRLQKLNLSQRFLRGRLRRLTDELPSEVKLVPPDLTSSEKSHITPLWIPGAHRYIGRGERFEAEGGFGQITTSLTGGLLCGEG